MALSDMIMFLLYHFNIGKGERIMQNLPCAGAVDGGYQWRIFINLSSRPPISHTTVMTQPYKLSQHRKYWISPTFISTSVVTLLLCRVWIKSFRLRSYRGFWKAVLVSVYITTDSMLFNWATSDLTYLFFIPWKLAEFQPGRTPLLTGADFYHRMHS